MNDFVMAIVALKTVRDTMLSFMENSEEAHGVAVQFNTAINTLMEVNKKQEPMPERMMVKELEQKYNAMEQELYEVEQILGEALSYPRYCDDLQNFPDATEADGICVGEMTPAALAEQMAKEYALLSEHGIKFFMKGIEASSLVSSLNQEKKDYETLARLFEQQTENLKTKTQILESIQKLICHLP